MLTMRSSIDPMALRPGEYVSLVNLVGNRFKVAKRWGCDLIGASRPFANSRWRGDSGLFYRDGTPMFLCAFEDPAVAVRIYSLNLSTYAWTELTAVGTRFSTLANVQFTIANEIIVACNGTEVRTIPSGTTVRAASAVTLPDDYIPTSQHWPFCWFNIQDPANTTYPTMTGAFTAAADTGASTDDNEIGVTMDTSTSGTLAIGVSSASRLDRTEEDYELFTGAGEMQIGVCSRHFAILVEDAIADPVFNYLNIQVRNNLAATKDIFVQSTIGTIAPLYLPTETAGVYLAVFDLSLYLDDISNYPSLDRLILTVYRPLPAGRSFRILGIYGLGNVPAGAKHAVALKHISGVESPSVVARKIAGQEIRFLGGSRLRKTRLPEGAAGQNVDWAYYVAIRDTINSEYKVNLFRKDPAFGEIVYYFVHEYASTPALSPTYTAALDTTATDLKNYQLKAPSANNRQPPTGPAITASAGRLFVQNGSSKVLVSDRDYPLRFTEIPRDEDLNGEIDDDSGTTAEFPGEHIQKMLPMPNVFAGYAPVLVFTAKALWSLEGPDPLSWSTPGRLNPHGTIYPWTVTTHKHLVYYTDAEKQPRAYAGGSQSIPLGLWFVEDQLEDGDIWDANGWVFKESYNICFRAPNATLKRKILRYEAETKGWWGHLYTSPNFASVFVQQTSGTSGGAFSTTHGSKQIGISYEGFVFWIEKPGQLQDEDTGGTPEDITIEIKKWLQGEALENYFFRHPCIIWQESADGQLTATFDTPQDTTEGGAQNTGVVDMDLDVPDEVWRFFKNATTGERPGVKSYGTFLTITGNPVSGKYCRGIGLGEFRPAKGGGADRP